uniref:SUZ domain-containing protein n=1 Tax=Kalanchoe fedtschenkoi TaxID=63787 RepID=A0A7N0V4N5_KALFE
MEQDVEKFIRDPKQRQLEFQQLPTSSYLRLPAHRVALHYFLQSMVLLDDSLPDGSGSRIFVTKTSECRLPQIRLADIPLGSPSNGSSLVNIAIKQRPQKRSQASNSGNTNYLKSNNSKSVEERKEEYNRARARIFNSSGSGTGEAGKQEIETKIRKNIKQGPSGISKIEDKYVSGGNDVCRSRAFSDSSTGGTRSSTTQADTEAGGRYTPNNRVAIFRDREIEGKDPDYDRSYDRYMQRFDPGFGFNGGTYPMQPMYTPAVNYNTEFPQLRAVHRPHIPSEHQTRPLPQHLPGPWSAATGVGYVHGLPETMMTTFGII